MTGARHAESVTTCVVHVGDGKTGTSAIQKCLSANREALVARGYLYLGLMFENVSPRYEWQRASRIEAFHALPPGRAAEEMHQALRDALALARERACHTIVLSNETLLGRSGAMIEALTAIAAEGVVVKPVAYVRSHDGWARSAYVQWGLRHKTYEGPIRDFASWAQRRDFGVHRKLGPWLDAFPASTTLRNFDATADAASDFLGVLGVEDLAVASMRVNETPGNEELALRALFNHGERGRVSPSRFNQLFHAQSMDFGLSLGSWLESQLPVARQLEDIADRYAEDRAQLNALLQSQGQPPLQPARPAQRPFEFDASVVLSSLFQIVADQAKRIEALEKRIEGAGVAAPGAPVPVAGAAAATRAPPARAPEALDEAVASALAPSRGFFGANRFDTLTIDVPGPLVAIRLEVQEDKPTFLNLRKLELLRAGKPVQPGAGRMKAEQSSIAGSSEANGPDALMGGSGIHSAAETSPWWRARFQEAIEVDQLRLWNRSDGWGCRSRSLKVVVEDANGHEHLVYAGGSRATLEDTLAAAARAAGHEPAGLPGSVEDARALRASLLAGVAARVRAGKLDATSIDWRAVVGLLDVWRDSEPGADEWTVMAGYLLAQHGAKGGTSIKSFSLQLNSRERLVRLQDELNRLGEAHHGARFMLTRHGVKSEGVLRKDPGRFLAHMAAVMEVLEAAGREPMMAYGTLLGAVRDGHFIAHDDDIDLLYRSRSSTRREAEEELKEVKVLFQDAGFKVVDLLPNSMNMHVIDPRNGSVMDVFPTWLEDGKMQMHMEAMCVRGIDPGILFPRGKLAFLEQEFPVPARPADYLAERYGPAWTVSDPFFEWPWKLK